MAFDQAVLNREVADCGATREGRRLPLYGDCSRSAPRGRFESVVFDLARRLDKVSCNVAVRLRHSRDPVIARAGDGLCRRALSILLTLDLKRPRVELDEEVRAIYDAYQKLEYRVARSRHGLEDRAEVTIGRALSYQLHGALTRQPLIA